MPELKLDPQIREQALMLAQVAAQYPQPMSVADRRAHMRRASALLGPTPAFVGSVRDTSLDLSASEQLGARLYEPQHRRTDTLLLFFHGGGWVQGDLDTHDITCQFISQELGAMLLALDYSLAPEAVFPVAYGQAEAALCQVSRTCNQWGCRQVAVAGDSAGGHLAAVAAHSAQELATQAMLLIYPVTGCDFDTRSYLERGNGVGLTREQMQWYWAQLVPQGLDAHDSRINLLKQQWQRPPPPCTLLGAWHDPLYDDARRYADYLMTQGAAVQFMHAPDMHHGFARYVHANAQAAARLREALLGFAALI